jgi:hypothetical protein
MAAILAAAVLAAIILAQTDTDPPHLVSLAITPATINVSSGDQQLVATVHLTDDISGLAGEGIGPTQVRFRSPSRNQFVDFIFRPEYNQVSGTPLDGVYVDTATIPKYAEAGDWTLSYFLVFDDAGNYQYLQPAQLGSAQFPLSFAVESDPADVTPPNLVAFDISPLAINTATDTQITFTARFTDDLSGMYDTFGHSPTQARFRSPSAGQFVDAIFEPSRNLVTGTPLDGTYVETVTVPAGAEAGLWELERFHAIDQVGNFQNYTSEDFDPPGGGTAILRYPQLIFLPGQYTTYLPLITRNP